MGTFYMNADNMFLSCQIETQITVIEITSDSVISRDFKWAEVARIGMTSNSGYNELCVNGVVIRGQQLKDLASDLFKSQLRVNHQGYCHIYVGDGAYDLEAFGVVRYRLNDMFGWSKYGVVPSITTMWDKCDLYTRRPIINLTEQQKLLGDYKSQLKNYESQMRKMEKELYLFEKRLEDKDEELKDYKLKLSVAEKELLRSEIRFEEKNKELKGSKEDELSSLVEKLFKEKDGQLKEYELQLKEKEKELSLCKDKNRVNALKVTVISLVDSLYHLKMSLQHKQHQLPTASNYVVDDVSSADDSQGENNLAQMTRRILEIIEHHSIIQN